MSPYPGDFSIRKFLISPAEYEDSTSSVLSNPQVRLYVSKLRLTQAAFIFQLHFPSFRINIVDKI